jgi:hypothetical protein
VFSTGATDAVREPIEAADIDGEDVDVSKLAASLGLAGVGTMAAECTACGERGVFGSSRTIGELGPLRIDGYRIHPPDGDAYYHAE